MVGNDHNRRILQRILQRILHHCLATAAKHNAVGPVLHTGEIDRAQLGKLIFEDAARRKQLNAALHPLIMLRIASQLLLLWLKHELFVVSVCWARSSSSSSSRLQTA